MTSSIYRWQIICDCGRVLEGRDAEIIACAGCEKAFTVSIPVKAGTKFLCGNSTR